ncbi:hypothetical protein [Streptomyces mutabilis]|uniref:hypothetical protein n=1 Tax=Streptomyces mutabilis TaxID=67332 RepID=UPI003440D4B3
MGMRNRFQAMVDPITGTHNLFFDKLTKAERKDPEAVAKKYADALYERGKVPLSKRRLLSRNELHVGLNVTPHNMDVVTKRAVLVSNVLTLSQPISSGTYHSLGRHRETIADFSQPGPGFSDHLGPEARLRRRSVRYGFNCDDLGMLGKWILEAEGLMRKGVLWYHPAFMQAKVDDDDSLTADEVTLQPLADYIVRDRRLIIDGPGADLMKGKVIRPIFSMELPFVDGVSLSDFSKITRDEFDSYTMFKGVLNNVFLSMDKNLEDTESRAELLKLQQEIESGVAEIRAKMKTAGGTRWAQAAGATFVTGLASFFVFKGSDLTPWLTAAGASTGGLGSAVLNAVNDRNKKHRDNKWYFAWALSNEIRPL